jgi:hypothetical protein
MSYIITIFVLASQVKVCICNTFELLTFRMISISLLKQLQ